MCAPDREPHPNHPPPHASTRPAQEHKKTAHEPARAHAPATASTPSITAVDSVDNTIKQDEIIYSFYDNYLHAHLFHNDDWVAAAQAGTFAKHIPFGSGRRWQQTITPDGKPVMRLHGKAAIAVPTGPQGDEPRHLLLRIYASQKGRLEIRWNTKRLPRVEIHEGWQTVIKTIPRAAWKPGENRVRFQTSRTRLHLSAIAVAKQPQPSLVETPPSARRKPLQRALALPAKHQLRYYVRVPPNASLVGKVNASDCAVSVSIVTHDEKEELQLDTAHHSLDLTKFANKVAQIGFQTKDCASATLMSAGIQVPSQTARSPGNGPPPRNVVLWIMDTLRADKLNIINPRAQVEIPGLTRLAKRGVVFRQAYVEGNESQTSHASFWTSVFPAVHNVRTAGNGGTWKIASRFSMLGELMKNAGMKTIALTANGRVTRHAGYTRGFDIFENPMRDGTGKRLNGWIPADRLYKRALEILTPTVTNRFFFFFGTIDTHKPWIGHEPWLSRYDPSPYEGKFKEAAWPGALGIKRGSMKCTDIPKPRDLKRIHAIYDSALSFQDAHLDKFLTWLKTHNVLDQTMIIVTADHGEELWEDGRCGHGASLRETLVHVPLVISYPPRLPAGVTVNQGVDGVDILPTILDVLDVAPLDQSQGQSLRPLAHRVSQSYPDASYASQYEYAHAMRIRNWKLRVGRHITLYNLRSDPNELESLTDVRPIERQHMLDVMRLFLRYRTHWKKRTWGNASNLSSKAIHLIEQVANKHSLAKK